MPAKKRPPKRKPRALNVADVPCTVHVSRGGVTIAVERVALGHAAELASFLLSSLQAKQTQHPELERPQEVVQFGGYTPVSTEDTDTWAKRVGF